MATEQKKKVAYDIVENQVLRQELPDGQVQILGIIENGVCTLQPDCERYRSVIVRVMRERKVEAVIADPVPASGSPVQLEPIIYEEAEKPKNRPISDCVIGLTEAQRKAVSFLRSKEGMDIMEVENPRKACPPETSGAGDKAPEVITWYLRYDPSEFVRRYGVYGLGSIEVVRDARDPMTGKMRKTRVRESGYVLARRETIFTKKQLNADDLEVNE
jgi:hypothetical protein